MRRMNKRGFEFISNWVPLFSGGILLLSFFLALILISPWVTYAIAVFVGIILGYFIRKNREGNSFPYFLLSFSFITGYLVGNGTGNRTGNGFLILFLFIGVMFITNKIMEATE